MSAHTSVRLARTALRLRALRWRAATWKRQMGDVLVMLREAERQRDELQRLVTEGTLAICERAEAIRQRDEARAILAWLLEDPCIVGEEGVCVFCYAEYADHTPDCPVLRKDALLGRDRATAPPEGPPT